MVQCRENIDLLLDLLHIVLISNISQRQNFACDLSVRSSIDGEVDGGERAASEGVRRYLKPTDRLMGHVSIRTDRWNADMKCTTEEISDVGVESKGECFCSGACIKWTHRNAGDARCAGKYTIGRNGGTKRIIAFGRDDFEEIAVHEDD